MIKEIKEDKLKASITVVSALVFVIGIIITLINSGNTYATSISDYYCSTNGYEVVAGGDNYYCCPNSFSYENNRCQKDLTEEYDYADCIADGYGFNSVNNYCYADEKEANKKNYTIAYSLHGGKVGSSAPTTAEVGATIEISNPTKIVIIRGDANGTGATVGAPISKSLTFAGWTSTAISGSNTGIGLDTTSALTGTSSNPTTSWDGSATKNIYFKNLRTTSGTVTMNATWESAVVRVPTVTKEGHTCGWSHSSSGTTITYESGSNYTISANSNAEVTLYAVCNPNGDINENYTISYSLHGGKKGSSSPTTAEVEATIEVSNPTKIVIIRGDANGTGATVGAPISKSLTFAGWTSTAISGSNTGIGLDTTSALTGTSSNPTTLWDGSATKNIYFKNLRTTSGTVTMNATWESAVVRVPTVTKEGHTCGWSHSSSGTTITYESGSNYTISANSNAEVTLYAVCNKNQGGEDPEPTDPENPTPDPGEGEETPTEYTLTYDANGGSGAPASSKTGIVSSTKPTRTGYTFVNWNTKKDGTGTSYASGSKYTAEEDATLYAQWKVNGYKISYTLNGGIATGNPTTGTYDSIIEIKNPTKTVTVVGNVNKTDATVGKINPVEQTFAGWTSSTINISTAYYGETAWTNGNDKVKETSFKNLTPVNSGTVTMVANWESVDITLPTIIKEGYTCKWNTKSDGKGTDYNQGEEYTIVSNSSATINMYAICEENTKADEEITENKQTGDILIVLAWIVGISALGYSVYYFRSRKFDM